jgi:hypothetical protein
VTGKKSRLPGFFVWTPYLLSLFQYKESNPDVIGTSAENSRPIRIRFMFFLLLVQKKERKKSTPATIYSRCRTP